MSEIDFLKYFPYDTPRPGQLKLASRAYSALTRGQHLVVQAPTGFGKTASLLTASLSAIERSGMMICYGVRTHREAEVVIRELRRIERKRRFPFVAAELRGRTHLCAMASITGSTPDIASRLCRAMIASNTCGFFNRTARRRSDRAGARREGVWDYRWAIRSCRNEGICPYFVLKSEAMVADILVSPYQYLLLEPLRRNVLRKDRRPRALVVDECVAEDTLVSTPGGDVEARRLREGHRLLSVFPEPRGRPSAVLSRVTGVRHAFSEETLEIRTEDDSAVSVTSNTRVLGLTGSLRWVRADALKPQDFVLSAENGQLHLTRVVEILRNGGASVYDFAVVPHHNYVANGIVVHNSHNLPNMFGELSSSRLKVIEIEEALIEALVLRSPVSKFIESLLRMLKERRPETAATLQLQGFVEMIREALKGVDPVLAMGTMRSTSERSQGEIISHGGTYESALARLFSFLRSAVQTPPDGLLQYVSRGRFPDDYLELSWWDLEFGLKSFRPFRSTIHMSGTNDWPDAYAALVGLPKEHHYLSVDPAPGFANCFVGILTGVMTRDDVRTRENYERCSGVLAHLANSLPGKSAIFAASFDVLNGLRQAGLDNLLPIKSFWESERMDSYEHEVILREFLSDRDEAILLGVAGGRSSEGVDFGPGGLNNSIVFGVPFPEPSPLMRRYADWLKSRFGEQGTDYAYVYPAVVRAAQALGRAPRSPDDKVVCILADERFSQARLLRRFPVWIRNNCRGVYPNHVILAGDIERFYSAKPG